MTDDDDFLFLDEEEEGQEIAASEKEVPWKILIVDDEKDVHEVTRMALSGFVFKNRSLTFLNAYSGEEGKELIRNHSDIALAIVDVVMETETSGLDLIQFIRHTLKNSLVRLILRTGQPGHAPEREVIQEYDIDDYKEKTELTTQKLFSSVYTGLRSYHHLLALEASRHGLSRVIGASAEIFKNQKLFEFLQDVLEQLVAVLRLDDKANHMNVDCLAVECRDNQWTVLAGTGQYADKVGTDPAETVDSILLNDLKDVIKNRSDRVTSEAYVTYFSADPDQKTALYITSPQGLDDDGRDLMHLFSQNVSIAYKNIMLNRELEESQREIVYMLGESIETRSKETGSHVRRVAEFSGLLARHYGLSDYEVELIVLASPLHDFGKIGIKDAVLHKPGKLDAEEWSVMQSHAQIGHDLLNRSNRQILKAAALIAGQHHEKWDGSGYPQGLGGSDIHVFARIVSLADVFDALNSKRSYKEPWPRDVVLEHITKERGKHFDPDLVDILLNHHDEFSRILDLYPDP